MKRLRLQALLVTRGRSGMALFDAGGEVELIPVHGAEEAVDVTGAGDTVIAALSLALASAPELLVRRGADRERRRRPRVQKQGTATVSRAELLGGARSRE